MGLAAFNPFFATVYFEPHSMALDLELLFEVCN